MTSFTVFKHGHVCAEELTRWILLSLCALIYKKSLSRIHYLRFFSMIFTAGSGQCAIHGFIFLRWLARWLWYRLMKEITDGWWRIHSIPEEKHVIALYFQGHCHRRSTYPPGVPQKKGLNQGVINHDFPLKLARHCQTLNLYFKQTVTCGCWGASLGACAKAIQVQPWIPQVEQTYHSSTLRSKLQNHSLKIKESNPCLLLRWNWHHETRGQVDLVWLI